MLHLPGLGLDVRAGVLGAAPRPLAVANLAATGPFIGDGGLRRPAVEAVRGADPFVELELVVPCCMPRSAAQRQRNQADVAQEHGRLPRSRP